MSISNSLPTFPSIKKAECYSVLANETMDICGTEHMSICIRYTFNENGLTTMREDFLGFIALNKLDAESISNSIIESLLNWGLDLNKLIGQGYDGARRQYYVWPY